VIDLNNKNNRKGLASRSSEFYQILSNSRNKHFLVTCFCGDVVLPDLFTIHNNTTIQHTARERMTLPGKIRLTIVLTGWLGGCVAIPVSAVLAGLGITYTPLTGSWS
jgi:hypothetical protein